MTGKLPTASVPGPDVPTVNTAQAAGEPDAPGLAAGRVYGRYTIVETLGVGGMGIVYRASDPALERDVALKVLGRRGRGDRWQDRSRLLREAKALARLSHPNVVSVYEVGEVDTELFIAMELVEGTDVREWLGKPRSLAEVLHVFRGAGHGLSAAHSAGLVHRDFKPANVLLGPDGRPRVTDFGLARPPRIESLEGPLVSGTSGGEGGQISGTGDFVLTADGVVVGTPAYMAPEQHVDGDLTPAVDQYAFCVALYEALFGERPFRARKLDDLLAAKHRGFPTPPAGRDVPGHIARAIRRGLAVSPADRFPDMSALLSELARDPAARRRRLALSGAALVGAAALAVVAGRRSATPDLCPVDPEALAGAWDPSIRARSEAAFAATARSYAALSFAGLAARLDDWAGRWRASRLDACEATAVRGEQSAALMDLRIACLNDQRESARALAGVLLEADASVVDRAAPLAAALPAPERCDDVVALRATSPEPGAAAEDEVARVRAELAKVNVVLALGRYGEARTRLREYVDAADRTEYAPLIAEVQLQLGIALDALAEPEPAQAALEKAVWLAYESGYDGLVAKAAFRLTWSVGVSQKRTEAAKVWAKLAESSLDRGRDDPFARARIYNVLGALAHDDGEADEAERSYQRAIDLVREAGGEDHVMIAGAMVNLAIVQSEQRRYDEALALQRRALEIRERLQGRDHPDTAALLNNISTVLLALDQADEAAQANADAIARLRATFGPEHPLVATALVQRAALQLGWRSCRGGGDPDRGGGGDGARARARAPRPCRALQQSRLRPARAGRQ
ncbi:MAG: serine/threonine-protein kinase [Myxococcota bacterium]